MSARRPLATPAEVAEFFGTTEAKLANDRYRGDGPCFVKLGQSVRYRWEEVERFVDEHTVQCTNEVRAAARRSAS